MLRLAQENPCWGYQRIVGEARKIGMQVSASSVRAILRRNALGPAPTRSRKGPSWVEFLKAQAAGTVAIDVVSVDTVTPDVRQLPGPDPGDEVDVQGLGWERGGLRSRRARVGQAEHDQRRRQLDLDQPAQRRVVLRPRPVPDVTAIGHPAHALPRPSNCATHPP